MQSTFRPVGHWEVFGPTSPLNVWLRLGEGRSAEKLLHIGDRGRGSCSCERDIFLQDVCTLAGDQMPPSSLEDLTLLSPPRYGGSCVTLGGRPKVVFPPSDAFG